MKKRIRIKTPAKINLHLRVVGKRPDGYHELETVFQAIDIKDEIVITMVDEESSLEAPGRPDLELRDNLIFKALGPAGEGDRGAIFALMFCSPNAYRWPED